MEDVDAAVEVPEVKKGEREAKLIHINQRDTDNKINLLHDGKKDNLDAALKPDAGHKEQENHPQVLPPNNFDIGDKDDHAAERGEYGNQVFICFIFFYHILNKIFGYANSFFLFLIFSFIYFCSAMVCKREKNGNGGKILTIIRK